MQGSASPEDLDKMSREEAVMAFIEAQEDDLKERAKFILAVDDIFDNEKLEVPPEDVEAEVAQVGGGGEREKDKDYLL